MSNFYRQHFTSVSIRVNVQYVQTICIMQASCSINKLLVSNGSSVFGLKKFTGHTSMYLYIPCLKVNFFIQLTQTVLQRESIKNNNSAKHDLTQTTYSTVFKVKYTKTLFIRCLFIRNSSLSAMVKFVFNDFCFKLITQYNFKCTVILLENNF